jgi:hypothetical protein
MSSINLVHAVEDVLQQGLFLLNSIDDHDFSRKIGGAGGSSIGGHYRHIIEHFRCLLDGLRAKHVNYDARARDRELETNTAYARAVTESLIEEVQQLPWVAFDNKISVAYSVGYGNDELETVPSSVAREVVFCVGHAIHHYAIVRLLCAQISLALPLEFGVAPSTLRYLRSNNIEVLQSA